MASSRTTKSQQTNRPVIFANFPTIKVIEPPKGTFSTQNDQWCLTYCSQNVSGRINNKPPWCRSVCLRKVFPHEVRNILLYKSHKATGSDGKAQYPLPNEGQPINLPWYLGGKPSDDPEHGRKSAADTKFWEEGFYFWKSKSHLGVYETISSMPVNLESQRRFNAMRDVKRQQWKDYQEFLRSGQQPTEENKWLGRIIPPNVGPETSSHSLLVHLPLDTEPFLKPIYQLLKPTQLALELLRENLTEGHFEKFAVRVWDKAWTAEPCTLASRAASFGYEQWKNRGKDSDDDDKENDA